MTASTDTFPALNRPSNISTFLTKLLRHATLSRHFQKQGLQPIEPILNLVPYRLQALAQLLPQLLVRLVTFLRDLTESNIHLALKI